VFVLGNALRAVAELLGTLAHIYVFILIGRVIISWVNADRFNPIVRLIDNLTEPLLGRIRRFVPPIAGLDFSILIAILLVQVGVQGFLVRSLIDLAHRLR